jgi:glutaryl-CoA dehydrogenase
VTTAAGPAAGGRTPWTDPDVLSYRDLLPGPDRARLDAAREVFDRCLRPLVPTHWDAGTFPDAAVAALAPLDLVALPAEPGRALLHGLVHVELARVDLSLSVFLGVQGVLVAEAVRRLGSPEQRARFLPDLRALRRVGAFALTEPEHGSDISRHMATTAVRSGGSWTLRGTKRWIGNGTHADHLLVWARDTADGEIKGFLVDRGTPGLRTSPVGPKIGLRIVQNADVVLDDVVVGDDRRLEGGTGFAATNDLLTSSRLWVAWQTVGLQFAAYDQALAYTLGRVQFGRPVAATQLVQEKLVRILENATTTLGLLVRLAQLQDEGRLRAEHAALAKASGSARMRESVAAARALLGGNGLATAHGVGRTFCDAEALYSYEGSHEINTLVVGRAVTGLSAF